MMATNRRSFIGLALALAALVSLGTFEKAKAATAEDLNKEAQLALDKLYRTNPVAKDISEKAEAVLVFPSIVKAGLVFGSIASDSCLLT